MFTPPSLMNSQALPASYFQPATAWTKWVLASQEQPFNKDTAVAAGSPLAFDRNGKGFGQCTSNVCYSSLA